MFIGIIIDSYKNCRLEWEENMKATKGGHKFDHFRRLALS